jgi:hypothetical protein
VVPPLSHPHLLLLMVPQQQLHLRGELLSVDAASGIPGVFDGTLTSLSVALPSTCHLPQGTYWVSMIANLDFATGGEHHPLATPVFEKLLEIWPDDGDLIELCWGDARPGNQMFDGPELLAIFDWEMVSLGNAESDLGWWLFVGIIGPLTITGLLLFVTGIPTLDKSADQKWGSNPEYRAYRARTSRLVPWPRRLTAEP